MLVVMWNNRNSHSLLVGVPNGTATLEDSLVVSYKTKHTLTIQSSNYTPQYLLSSVTQSCPTLCDPMNRSTPGLPVHCQLPESTQTYVHQVSDAIQPSHPLSSPSLFFVQFFCVFLSPLLNIFCFC